MTEQQEPFGESEQMWVPDARDTIQRISETYLATINRALLKHLRHPEPAAVGLVVQQHAFVRDRAQVVRILHAYAEALERVILPAVKP